MGNNKNSKKTMNVRTHNPFELYRSTDYDDTSSNSNNPEDNQNVEYAEEFDSKIKNKNNATNHDKNQQSNKRS